MKKTFILMALSLLIFVKPVLADDISVTLDNEKIEFTSASPVIIDSRTLIPLRGVFENLGYEINWDGAAKTASIEKSGTSIIVFPNANSFKKNGEEISLDVPAQIINNSMFLPLRALGEAAGINVSWDQNTRTVNLTSYIVYNEITELIDNFQYYYIATDAIDNYIETIESGVYKNEIVYYSIDIALFNYVVLANLAQNLNDYIDLYTPETLYSQEFKTAVDNLFSEAYNYYVKVATDNSNADSAKLTESISQYNEVKESFLSDLDSRLSTYVNSVNTNSSDLSSYKSKMIEFVNTTPKVELNYTNDDEFYSALENYTKTLRNYMKTVTPPEDNREFEYALIYTLNSINQSIANIKAVEGHGNIMNFYDKYSMSNAEQDFFSKIINTFYGNTSAKIFKEN